MSGAAGLSSARRRRAGGGSETPTTNEKITQQQLNDKPISYAEVLLRHESRLNEITKAVNGLSENSNLALKNNQSNDQVKHKEIWEV